MKDGFERNFAFVAGEVGDLVGDGVPDAVVFFWGGFWRCGCSLAGVVRWVEIWKGMLVGCGTVVVDGGAYVPIISR